MSNKEGWLYRPAKSCKRCIYFFGRGKDNLCFYHTTDTEDHDSVSPDYVCDIYTFELRAKPLMAEEAAKQRRDNYANEFYKGWAEGSCMDEIAPVDVIVIKNA